MKSQEPKPITQPIRKNKQPERDLVEKPCFDWLRLSGFRVQKYDARGVYDPGRNRYVAGRIKTGTVDCEGLTPWEGVGCAIEFKAPGRRIDFNANKNYRQKQYLLTRLEGHAFACVVDSLDLLIKTYANWLALRRKRDLEGAKRLLLDYLP